MSTSTLSACLPRARAVLWDMDGTLLDSAELHWQSWQGAMTAAGYTVDEKYFVATFGQRNARILRGLLGPDAPDSLIARIGDDKEARYRELVRAHGVELLPGVRCWLATLRAGGWQQAVASSAPRLNVETVLAVLGVAGYFDVLVSSEDVRQGKPDPQVFLLAAARLAVPPARCVVVEDSPFGIEGARRAGMGSIGVGSAYAALPADYAVPTLADLPDDAFERLADRRM